jgi:prevent-host-death family protein
MAKEKFSVNTVEAKNRLNELIAQAGQTKKPIVVEKRGKPVAVMLDYESYQKSSPPSGKKRKGEDPFLKELQAFHQLMKKKYPEGTGDSVEILRGVRQERSGS